MELREKMLNLVSEFVEGKTNPNYISANKLAKELGISASYLSQYLSQKLKPSNVKTIEDKFLKYLNNVQNYQKAIKEYGNAFEFIETQDYRVFAMRLDVARVRESKILVITGRSGVGKTTACKHYRDTCGNVVLIEATPFTKATDIINKICKDLGIEKKRSVDANIYKIAQHLANENRASKHLIIIDEAEHLKWRELELLRRISDISSRSIVLVGTKWLDETLNKANKINQDYTQIKNRTFSRYEFKGLAFMVGKEWNLNDLKEYCKNKGVDDACYPLLLEKFSGVTRSIENALDLARVVVRYEIRHKGRENDLITKKDLQAAFAQM